MSLAWWKLASYGTGQQLQVDLHSWSRDMGSGSIATPKEVGARGGSSVGSCLPMCGPHLMPWWTWVTGLYAAHFRSDGRRSGTGVGVRLRTERAGILPTLKGVTASRSWWGKTHSVRTGGVHTIQWATCRGGGQGQPGIVPEKLPRKMASAMRRIPHPSLGFSVWVREGFGYGQ